MSRSEDTARKSQDQASGGAWPASSEKCLRMQGARSVALRKVDGSSGERDDTMSSGPAPGGTGRHGIEQMRLRTFALALVILGSALGPAARVFAQDASVDPVKVKAAAEEFDAGRRAYKQREFGTAAAHFENAFRDAPSAQAIRMAIRARQEAGDLARAATLCVRAQALYPEDRETVTLAQRILQDNTPKLQKVTLNCDPACTVTLDGKVVRDDAATSQVIFADPGEHSLVAGWSKDRSVSRPVSGKEGSATTLEVTAPPEPEAAPPAPSPTSPAPAPTSTSAASTPAVEVSTSKGAPPMLFWLALGTTTVVGGITVWSGLDARANPGPDTVREKCVGLGTACPEYQDGLSKERRTNYLLAGTGIGVASTAVIGLFFTDWGDRSGGKQEAGARVTPMLDTSGGVGLNATGRF